jgi:hypothetical protein
MKLEEIKSNSKYLWNYSKNRNYSGSFFILIHDVKVQKKTIKQGVYLPADLKKILTPIVGLAYAEQPFSVIEDGMFLVTVGNSCNVINGTATLKNQYRRLVIPRDLVKKLIDEKYLVTEKDFHLDEGLKANWNINTVSELTPQKLKALTLNAQKAGDERVLGIIKQVEQERYDVQVAAKKAADAERKARKEEAARRKGDGFSFGDYFLTKQDLFKVARKFEEVVGDTFPDGDPIDRMAPWIKREFRVPDWFTGEILDKSVEVHLGAKSYTKYLANSWDDFVADGMFPELENYPNPWK